MDHDDSHGLLKSILGFFARKPLETSTPPTSLRSQVLDAWLRTDAYLQHEIDDFGEIDPEQVARTLGAFENLVQHDSARGPDSVSTVSTLQIPVPQPLTFCPLTQGRGAELTPHCVIPKAPSGSQHDPAPKLRCELQLRHNHPH